jgi:DNA-binding NtrC family response regulator
MRLLAVSPTLDLQRRLRGLFEAEGSLHEVEWEGHFERVLDRFESESFDVLLVSGAAFHSSRDGVETLDVLADRGTTQVLFLLEPQHVGLLRGALRGRPYLHAREPVSDDELRGLLAAAPALPATPAPDLPATPGLGDLVGTSPAMQEVARSIRQAAATDIPVLIQGETGTGKDRVARIIHEESPRSGGPYVPLNVGAIPPELVASELFGHEAGAFPGAQRRHPGRFEQAAGGSVFLDEIGNIAEREQISLLRFLAERQVRRLGATGAVPTDVRLLAATSVDLTERVRAGTFRDDLLFRLDVFRIHLPGLRERHGDVPLLAGHYLQRYNRLYGKQVYGLTPECTGLLQAYPWPGNVRELRNVMQRAVLLCGGETITPDHLPARLRQPGVEPATVSFRVGMSLDEVEREMIVQTLRATSNNRQEAARLLGISRRTLYNKLARYDID